MMVLCKKGENILLDSSWKYIVISPQKKWHVN